MVEEGCHRKIRYTRTRVRMQNEMCLVHGLNKKKIGDWAMKAKPFSKKA